MRRLTLTGDFAIRSLVMTLVFAGLLAVVSGIAVRSAVVRAADGALRRPIEAVLVDRLADELPASRLSSATVGSVDAAVRSGILGGDLVGLTVFDAEGTVVYSTLEARVGRRVARHGGLGSALQGRTRTKVVRDAADADSGAFVRRHGPLAESFVPLRDSAGKIVGAYELDHRYSSIAAVSSRTVGLIWAVIVVVSILVYAGQIGIVRSAERSMDRSEAQLLETRSRLQDSLAELESHSVGTLQALVTAVDAKDSYTSSHSLGVADCARAIGRRLGLGEDDLLLLEKASLLHDIGKIGVPERLLLKPDVLTREEHAIVSEHAELGARIVESVPFLGDVVPIIRHHHERWDGKGYPARLKGESIPLLARVLAVADSYDAMTSDRPYRSGLRWFRVRQQLRRNSGSQFDPDVIAGLLQALRAGEVSTDGRRTDDADAAALA